jgi:GDP-4-dehydro-6-deoxy-D-mannose reductase
VPLLAESGEDVVAWGLSHGGESNGVTLDLLDRSALATHDLAGIEAVIHLAGLAQGSDSFAEPAEYVTSNTTMEINLFEEFTRQRCLPKVLVVSSGSVYRGDGETPVTEESPVSPSTPYVVSKLAQEMLAWYYSLRGFEVIVARPFNHIGPGQQRGYLVADLASQIAALELSGGNEVTVGNLASTRDYTDVRDVADAYYDLIRNGRPGETYNVCSGRSYSGQEVLARLVELSDRTITVVSNPTLTRPTDVPTVTASNAKIRDETGWAPAIALDDTLADALDYWRRAERAPIN